MAKYNYVLIEEYILDKEGDYVSYMFSGFNESPSRQLIRLNRKSSVIDIRDMKIKSFNNDAEYCFIVGGRIYEYYGKYLISFIRNRYYKCKILLILTDMIKTYHFEHIGLKKYFDLVCSFEKSDSMQYDFCYLPWTIGYKNISRNTIQSDFFFCGRYNEQKGRMKQIIDLYDNLSKRGYKCDFWLPDISPETKEMFPEIHVDTLRFDEMVNHIAQTRCVVEITQNQMVSPTLRSVLAIFYGKYIISNNYDVCDDVYYNDYKMFCHSLDEDDYSFIYKDIEYVSEKAISDFSNDSFVSHLDKYLVG